MRVVLFVKALKNSAAGVAPSRELLDGMARYSDELTRAGIVLPGRSRRSSPRRPRRTGSSR
jgi:hypothetical protein